MKLVVRNDDRAVAAMTARLIADLVKARPDCVLGLATGRTMERVYGELVGISAAEGLDFSRCRTFNLDEYIGLPPGSVHSYRTYMNEHLFSRIDIPIGNTMLPDGSAADLVAEAARYEDAIRRAGGIDLQLVGIGETGHIGFNEPLSPFTSRTRDITLAPGTRRQNAALFDGDIDAVPQRALTMGVGTILEARRIVLVATGSAKASILAQAVEGPVTSMISATALHFHQDTLAIVDEDVARHLGHRDYYDSIFATDPEFAPFRA
ncbi:glucosamine-6-phosphate deaminase [Gluconacetobacter tumulisoli]|uniref:Glucosamine-6-phosphate deaminase n=1 Tax=Gluconacetobacter tumulisoli TaxID=1286189 RepID=A0A7W4PKJ7_9PROT|nr:glucosamine-6-phosphate deaminase [Gluconacetobacter tumulisoli]MBB2200918.1 glucosamine-6-phosphate deaminase [Gluconacetobacter tumulisoli]